MIISKQFLENNYSATEETRSRTNTLGFMRARPSRLVGLYEKFTYDVLTYDVFISYSFNDKFYVQEIVKLLKKSGYSVYVDYDDLRLDRNNVNEKTARMIVAEMKKCKALLYIYSPNSTNSKWCPWEVGVFSGIKNFKCVNLPLVEKEGDSFKNQEYLELYPYISYSKGEFWVCETDHKYVSLEHWLRGDVLLEHAQTV